ncbi:hypothetical protein ACLOJK_027078 [Asimina triloba]
MAATPSSCRQQHPQFDGEKAVLLELGIEQETDLALVRASEVRMMERAVRIADCVIAQEGYVVTLEERRARMPSLVGRLHSTLEDLDRMEQAVARGLSPSRWDGGRKGHGGEPRVLGRHPLMSMPMLLGSHRILDLGGCYCCSSDRPSYCRIVTARAMGGFVAPVITIAADEKKPNAASVGPDDFHDLTAVAEAAIDEGDDVGCRRRI